MKKRGKMIIGIVIALVIIAVIVNYGLKGDLEVEIEEPEQLEDSLGNDDIIQLEGEDVESTTLEIVEYKEVFPEEANKLIKDNSDIIIIDVSFKYNSGHIPNAVNYRYNDGTLENELSSLDKQAKYLVYSSSDPDAKNAAQLMVDTMFQEVYMLKGSYGLWIQEGYDYERSYLTGYFVFDNWF